MNELEKYDWTITRTALDTRGWAILPELLEGHACRQFQRLYDDNNLFRSRVEMHRHSFGEGQYKYFDYPLPQTLTNLRESLYEKIAPVANDWAEKLNNSTYPGEHAEFLAHCHEAGQVRPTPLLLKYETGGYNRLHQDLYGKVYFPIQAAILLSQPGTDFDGGEFVITEQKPRSQSRAAVVPLNQGDAILFAVNDRPAKGQRGYYRLKMRHGVSDIRSGERYTLGVIFHDAT